VSGPHSAANGAFVTYTVALSAATSLNGYDLTVQWDTSELTLTSASQLFPDSLPPDTFAFTVSPLAGTPGDARTSTVSLTAFTTTSLFSLTFTAANPVADGLDDVRVFADPVNNGNGLSPGTVTLDNPTGVGFDVTPAPEPDRAALLLASLGTLSVLALRARHGS